MQRVGRWSAPGVGSRLPARVRAWGLATTPGLSFSVCQVSRRSRLEKVSPCWQAELGLVRCWVAGRGGAGRADYARVEAGLAEAGLAEPAGGQRGAQCVQLRSARLHGRGHHMSRGTGPDCSPPAGAPAAPQPRTPALLPGPNHVYLLLLLFQGLWQFQEKIR
jgi:hypothetical protein